MKYLSLSLVAIALALVGSSQQAELTLSVYYETLCPDSIRFITRHLLSTFNLLGGLGNPYLDVDYVPYGKANTTAVNGTYTFICQHGDDECEGNKMQACALSIYPDYAKGAFINCTMSSSFPPTAGPACAERLWLNWQPVQDCWDSLRGPELLAANGNRTHSLSPPLYYVPWITYNGVWTVEDMNNSQLDLLAVVCQKLQNSTQPVACTK